MDYFAMNLTKSETSPPSFNQPIKFLIVRLSALGDTVHSLTLAAALRKLYPHSFIGWVAEKPAAPFIVANPLLNWWKILPKDWLKSPLCLLELRQALKTEKFDVAFDVQSLSKSAVVAWLSGAPQRIGFARGWGRELAPLLDNYLIRPTSGHVVDQTLELLFGLGKEKIARPEIKFPPCPPTEKRFLDDYLHKDNLENGFYIFAPWTTNLSKNWPLYKFAALALRLNHISGRTALVLGHGSEERQAAATIIADTPLNLLHLAPELTLLGVVELIRRTDLLVGCDSFPLHVAAALGRPAVGLFGTSDPQRVGPEGPKGRNAYEQLQLASSSRARNRLGPEAIASLSVDKVETLCLELLSH